MCEKIKLLCLLPQFSQKQPIRALAQSIILVYALLTSSIFHAATLQLAHYNQTC